MDGVLIDLDQGNRTVTARDARFDGQFILAVRTTGIYCRPSCPAIPPKRRNVEFYPTAAAAQQAGYRTCRRCLPDAVPGSPEWNLRADPAGRAMRLIPDVTVEREGSRTCRSVSEGVGAGRGRAGAFSRGPASFAPVARR